MGKYDDIIASVRPEPPEEHTRMSIHDRAAQFMGFRALTGHDMLIDETVRFVNSQYEHNEIGDSKL